MMNLVRKKNQKKNFWFQFPLEQSGSVLILSVWMMTLFSFWVISSAAAGFFSLGVGRRFEGDMKAYALARSAIPYVQKILEDDETPKHDGENEAILTSKEFYVPQSLGEGTFEIGYEYPNPYTGYLENKSGLLDEERKLNLNTVNTDTLIRLFTAKLEMDEKVKEKEIQALVDSIEDWRDEDNDRRDLGAEKFEYLVLKKSYECKNGPFESVEELLLVKGMSPEIFKKVRPYLTVYGSGKVNLNTASAQVLSALGISDAGVSGMALFRVGLDGESSTEDDGVIVNMKAIGAELGAFIPAEDANQIAKLSKEDLVAIGSSAFSFTAKAKLDSYAYAAQIQVVMDREGQVLAWQEE